MLFYSRVGYIALVSEKQLSDSSRSYHEWRRRQNGWDTSQPLQFYGVALIPLLGFIYLMRARTVVPKLLFEMSQKIMQRQKDAGNQVVETAMEIGIVDDKFVGGSEGKGHGRSRYSIILSTWVSYHSINEIVNGKH